MTSKFPPSRASRALLLVAFAAIGFVLSMVILRNGLKAWPDSWYDWQGSINLIEHGTYTTMLGASIHEWPPLYSAYLALFEIGFGQTGWSLILATAVLTALNVVVWGSYTYKVFSDDAKASPLLILASLAFLALFLPLYFISILPNGLLLLFIGFILHLLAAIAEDSTSWGGIKKSVFVGLLLGAAVFTHNSSIVYIAASICVVFVTMPTTLRPRLGAIAVILFISGVAWALVPHGLTVRPKSSSTIVSALGPAAPVQGDQGTHFLFDPMFSFWEYLVQFPSGLGVFFLSMSSVAAQAVVGWAILGSALVLAYRKPESTMAARHRLFLIFGLVAFMGHFAIFNLIWLDTVFGDRFAWYFAMICVPIFFSRFRPHTLVVAAMLIMVLGVSGWRVFKVLRTGIVPALVAQTDEIPLNAIHPEFFLTSRPAAIAPPGTFQIEPPVYNWQTTASGGPPAHVHATVILIRHGQSPP